MAEDTASTTPAAPASRRPLIIGAGIVIVVLVAGFFVWRHLSPRESTDDAQIAGHVAPVAARVGGAVKAVHVGDNQVVKAGDVLVEIDPRDSQIALAKAQADLAAAEAAARAAHTDVPIASTTTSSQLSSANASTGNAEANVQATSREVDAARAKVGSAHARLSEAQANAKKVSQDLERLRPLVAKDEISKQQFDAAVAADEAAKATVTSAQSAVTEAEANVAVAEARQRQSEGQLDQAKAQARAAATAPQQVALTAARADTADAQVQQARAAVDAASLNLERATIRAATDGVVSRKSVEAGQVIQPGQALMLLTSLSDVWVVANFKETQLGHMQVGQEAEVEVDAFGGKTFIGKIESIAAATGSTFSLLPPDNATGNFVKVVQRIPVKIALDPASNQGHELRPGMSVTAKVFLK
jgi:membrane fusion protein (multidrug efflux system)